MFLNQILEKGIADLKHSNIPEANLNAKLLLANVLKCKKEELVIRFNEEIEASKQNEFFCGIERLKQGYPLQYITGRKEFMGMEFLVNDNVLIPRADTEMLVEEAISFAKKGIRILDLCTGSGAIAISLAKYIEDSYIVASDISKDTLEAASLNAKRLLMDKQIEFIESDMFENIEQKFDIIISNPPYIKKDVIKAYNLKYEPILALDGGADGLDFYRIIVRDAYKYLNEKRKSTIRNWF